MSFKRFFKFNYLFPAIFLITIGFLGGLFYFKSNSNNYYLNFIFGEGNDVYYLEYGPKPVLENADFFKKAKDKFISEEIDFVEANLTEMKLRVYRKGKIVEEVPILTKGKKGSWWETPAGLYQIESKRENHFSSFGDVYMPWSMQFQGNFFIHGWPYYSDGKEVSSSYSGGCVRLSTPDAEKVYKLVKTGTPVLVFEEGFKNDEFVYGPKIKNEINAEAFLAADLKNNFVFLEKSTKEVLPIASLTKLMTALVATEYINLDKEITIRKEMIINTSKPRLKVGEGVSVFDLLYPLMLESSNESAEALSYILGPEYFVNLMNRKAQALGMENSHFEDSAGMSVENTSTLEDLFNLAKYIYNNRRFILQISKGGLDYTAYGPPKFTDLSNFNVFYDDPDFVGGKVGKTTAAKETIISIFELEINGEKRPVVIIVLGSEDNDKDAKVILDYIRETY